MGTSAPSTPENMPIVAEEGAAEADLGVTEAGDQSVVQDIAAKIRASNPQARLDEFLEEKKAEEDAETRLQKIQDLERKRGRAGCTGAEGQGD